MRKSLFVLAMTMVLGTAFAGVSLGAAPEDNKKACIEYLNTPQGQKDYGGMGPKVFYYTENKACQALTNDKAGMNEVLRDRKKMQNKAQ